MLEQIGQQRASLGTLNTISEVLEATAINVMDLSV
jgi:hypothetical protein